MLHPDYIQAYYKTHPLCILHKVEHCVDLSLHISFKELVEIIRNVQ